MIKRYVDIGVAEKAVEQTYVELLSLASKFETYSTELLRHSAEDKRMRSQENLNKLVRIQNIVEECFSDKHSERDYMESIKNILDGGGKGYEDF